MKKVEEVETPTMCLLDIAHNAGVVRRIIRHRQPRDLFSFGLVLVVEVEVNSLGTSCSISDQARQERGHREEATLTLRVLDRRHSGQSNHIGDESAYRLILPFWYRRLSNSLACLTPVLVRNRGLTVFPLSHPMSFLGDASEPSSEPLHAFYWRESNV
jgi:hypothetical protein